MGQLDVLVIGGGIAGLATSWHLPRAGVGRVCLLEREILVAAHASGHNAGIFRHLDQDSAGVSLALRSREILAALEGTEGGLLRFTGALFLGTRNQLARMRELARQFRIVVQLLDAEGVCARVPVLAKGAAEYGLLVHEDGVLDVHGLCQMLLRAAINAGVTVRTGATVKSVLVEAGRVRGVRLDGGETILADTVVIAAGAWAAELGETCGAPLPIEPRRRHLVMLVADENYPLAEPVIWRMGEEVYFRSESGGILASPCDEEPWPPGVPPCSPEMLTRLAELLVQIAPRLVGGRALRTWACLRSFAPDRGIVVGPDPRLPGLFWVAGLGGRGMTCGLAVGEVAAATISGRIHPLAEAFSPARLLVPGGKGA